MESRRTPRNMKRVASERLRRSMADDRPPKEAIGMDQNGVQEEA